MTGGAGPDNFALSDRGATELLNPFTAETLTKKVTVEFERL